MRSFSVLAVIFITSFARGQDSTNLHFDTIRVQGCHAPKVVVYDLDQNTIYVSYKDFMRTYKPFWKMYKKSGPPTARQIEEGKVNPDYGPRYRVVDSMYKYLTTQVKTADTIVLYSETFIHVGLGGPIHFDYIIETGRFDLRDGQNNLIRYILRRKESHAGWGGRLYFIPGEKKYFYAGMDWVN